MVIKEEEPCGPHRASAAGESDGSVCFSDADDRSWHSPYNSNCNGSRYDEFRCSGASSNEIDGVDELCRSSCVSDCPLEVDLEYGSPDIKVNLEKIEKDCRICHLGLESNAPESGIAIVLGCSCKDDLAAAHKQCAETWFKIRGNKTCEICGSTAKNVAGAGETELVESSNETASSSAAISSAASSSAAIYSPTNVMFKNIIGTSSEVEGVNLICSPTKPCKNVHLEDIHLDFVKNGIKSGISSVCSNIMESLTGNKKPSICQKSL